MMLEKGAWMGGRTLCLSEVRAWEQGCGVWEGQMGRIRNMATDAIVLAPGPSPFLIFFDIFPLEKTVKCRKALKGKKLIHCPATQRQLLLAF